jgi:hypothetical protein
MRYLIRDKFEWLLQDRGIYVGPASEQSDSQEGIYNFDIISGAIKLSTDIGSSFCNEINECSRKYMMDCRELSFIRSWYKGGYELQEMWKRYGKDRVVLVGSEELLSTKQPSQFQVADGVIRFRDVTYDDRKRIRP